MHVTKSNNSVGEAILNGNIFPKVLLFLKELGFFFLNWNDFKLSN